MNAITKKKTGHKLDLDVIQSYIDKKWLRTKIKGNLQILCYSEVASRKKGWQWDEITRQCRGLVINKNTGEIIAYCMEKSFNCNERPETLTKDLNYDEPCHITEKLDGSLCHSFISPDTNELIHTTKCAFDTTYSKKAKEFFPDIPISMYGYTFVSEIRLRDSEDDMRRVTKQKPGLYLITVFDKEGNEFPPSRIKDIVEFLNFPKLGMVKHLNNLTLKDISESYPFDTNTEGYVVRFQDGRRIKFKTAWYRERNLLLDEINDPIKAKEFVKACFLREKTRNFIYDLPKEYQEEVGKYVDDLVIAFGIRKQIIELMVRNTKDLPRKEIGRKYGKHPYQGPFFFMLDGKIEAAEELIWESL